MKLPTQLSALIDLLSQFPGVGNKTALRFALYLTNKDEGYLKSLSKHIEDLSLLRKCPECGSFLDDSICLLCSDQKRGSSKTLCVVENILDCMSIEKSGEYHGNFHILGGVLNPLLGVGPKELGLDLLFERISKRAFETIILALNPTVEGDATCAYIKQELAPEISVERIGFGIPIGGSLEYLDTMTISKALENRRKM